MSPWIEAAVKEVEQRITTNKITMDGKYQTRDGRAVRILATDLRGGGVLTVIGLVMNKNENEMIETWTTDGHVIAGRDNPVADLIPAPTKHEGWMVFDKSSYALYSTKEVAQKTLRQDAGMQTSDVVAYVTWEG